jgi:hypothetical protein
VKYCEGVGVRAETALEGNNNKGPLEAEGAHAGPQAPRLLQGKERREDSPCLCVSVCVTVLRTVVAT